MPQTAQQDYIYIDVLNLDSDGAEFVSAEARKQLQNCVKNGTIYDVILRTTYDEVSHENARIISSLDYVGFFQIAFHSQSEGEIVTWQFEKN